MNSFFQFLPSLFSSYTNESEYNNLSSEEKNNMDYFNECLYSTDEKFSYACFKIMMMILDLSTKIDTENEPTDEEVQIRKNKILDNFNDDDKKRLEYFIYVCIQNMGIYSEERVLERKLKNERK